MSRKRLLIGIGVLCLVDIIWVVSAELSEYIFHESDFNKPFFTTYIKTSIFVIYFFGFVLGRWRYQIRHIRHPASAHQNMLIKVTERLQGNQEPKTPYGTTECSTTKEQTAENPIVPAHKRGILARFRVPGRLGRALAEEGNLMVMSVEELEESRSLLVDVCAKISLRYTVFLSLLFVVLWVLATLMYQYALSNTSAAVTNILSSTSGIFTLLLAALFPSSPADKFSISKLLATLASFGGVFIICWTDPSRGDTPTSFNIGDIYALLGAIFYACYLVLVRRKVGDEGNLDIPLFLGFVGFFGLLLFWPLFFILHYTGVETFQLPDATTWMYILLNGFIGTALSELLWLWGCFLTSSLMATLALGFVSPMTLVWDLLGITSKQVVFSNLFFVGTAPIIVSFIIVSILTHYGDWDPIRDLMKRCSCVCCSNTVGTSNEGVAERNSEGGEGTANAEHA